MKNVLFFCSLGLACASVMAQGRPVEPAAAPAMAVAADHIGFVKSVQGKVHLVTATGIARVAHAGDKLLPAERIVSEADGSAGLVLRDGTSMVVGPSSQLEVRQFAFDSTTLEGNVLVSLLRGSMRMISGLIGKTHPEAVQIDTQTATIGIRGTDFIVLADAQL